MIYYSTERPHTLAIALSAYTEAATELKSEDAVMLLRIAGSIYGHLSGKSIYAIM